MYDVIFVRLKQDLSMTFWKYQLQYAYFRSRISLDHTHIYLLVLLLLSLLLLLLNFTCIKYSMYDVIFVWLMQNKIHNMKQSTVYDGMSFVTIFSNPLLFIIIKYSRY